MRLLRHSAMTLVAALILLVLASRFLAWQAEARFPPAGNFADIEGVSLHYIDVPAGDGADLPPIVFLHGASGNARDLHGAFADALKGRARLVFPDRPGAGYSERGGPEMAAPDEQARLIAGLLRELGIDRAIIVGHSLGSAVAAAFGVSQPALAAGLVFVAPATHPWPGGAVDWYYTVSNIPLIGRIFSETVAVPFGNLLYRRAVKGVFEPEKVAPGYVDRSGTQLVLRPANFRFNAQDVGRLFANVQRLAPLYPRITAPAVIITGDRDTVVRPDIHSLGLERDLPDARLVWLPGVGHAPPYTSTSAIIAEIEALAQRIAGR
jgi:pimeloyl-ACP methyl ester carboxylesterase